MNKIYAVRRASNPCCRELEFDVMDIARYALDHNVPADSVIRFSELNTSMAGWWEPIITNFYDDPDDQNKDFPEVCPWIGGTLILSPRAYRLLRDSLKNDGEFLPILVNGEEYQIFNCLSLGLDDVDASCVVYDGDVALWVESLITEPSNDKQMVFKSPLEKGATLFCSSLFKEVVESLALRGLSFDEELIE